MEEEMKMEEETPSPHIFVEKTLAIIKPDTIHKAEEIEEIILNSGFTILQKRKLHLSPEQCSDFYAEHYGKMFFPSLTAFMSSAPVIVMVLARNGAVQYWKDLMGPSNSLKARETHPNSLRAIYGKDDLQNAVHGSDCIITAEREIQFMFPHMTVDPVPVGQAATDYLSIYVNPTLLSGLTALCKQKPADPIIFLADWLLEHNPNKPRVRGGPVVEEVEE
ncbi:nucleoside diphosphate kinase homolog 5 [Protopterus annectens]|uniref:nucleoside diphosphate kinase homolog 5 n=1 Tax=Protopterus annectens TaxID=7888 RepID=UPI001CFA613D|nr:nucleoside diphosphate kinase homolog 5 [Protopterus annectens]XP_043924908.1 nucleoside diphosphate kinase homolog 5 [Protopterus annectens]